MVRRIEDGGKRRRFDTIRKFCKAGRSTATWCKDRKHQVKCTMGNCPKLKKG